MDETEFEKFGFSFLFLSIASAALAEYSGYGFSQSDYFIYGWSETDEWTNEYGYDAVDFVYYLLNTFFFPLAIVFMLLFMSHSYKRIPNTNRLKLWVYSILLVGFIIVTAYSYLYGRNILSCLSYFCIGGTEYNSTATVLATFLGAMYFFVSLFFCLGFMLLIYLTMTVSPASSVVPSSSDIAVKDGHMPREDSPLIGSDVGTSGGGGGGGGPSKTKFSAPVKGLRMNSFPSSERVNFTGQHSVLKQAAIVALVLLVLYPILIFACMLLPTWWNLFTWAGIQYYQSLVPDLDLGYYASWTSGSVVMKLFPDIIIFYGFIYVVALAALLCLWSPSWRSTMRHRPVHFGTFSVGQVLLTASLVAMVAGQFFYWYYDHGWELMTRSNFTDVEMAARSMGQVANVLMGLLLLPASKNNVLSILFGISWEDMLIWHQVLAYSFLVACFIHMCLFWVVFQDNGSFPHDILNVPEYYHGTNFAVPLGQVGFYAALIFIGVLAFYKVRRWWYEIFYYAHIGFVPIFILIILWHATMAWYFILGGLVLYVVDVAIRLSGNVTTDVFVHDISIVVPNNIAGVVESSQVSGGVVQLAYRVSKTLDVLGLSMDVPVANAAHRHADRSDASLQPLAHQMGQYCFINIPDVDSMEWHPFTISSAPVDGINTHHIKSMGENEWTGRLYSLAQHLESFGPKEREIRVAKLKVAIDGPYGVPLHIRDYSHVLLVAGGVGITPLHSCWRQMYLNMINAKQGMIAGAHNQYSHVRSCRLIWVVKSYAEASMFNETFGLLSPSGKDGIFSVDIYVSQNRPINPFESNAKQLDFVHSGRPPLASEIAALRSVGHQAIVFSCGPESLVHECDVLSMHAGVHFKHETFMF